MLRFYISIPLIGTFLLCASICVGQENTTEAVAEAELAKVFESSFDQAEDFAEHWQVSDEAAWKFTEEGRLSLFQKASSYEPPFRSPRHLALLKGNEVTDFQLDVKVLSTHEDYGHRDACLFFGYQSPSQFYYVHLGKKADPHANQIFIVNNAARTKVSLTTTEGTAWDDKWHAVRLVRDASTGEIKVFFDDMETPAMTANDKTFGWGRIGVGSFDDIADFDDLVLRGQKKQ